MRNGFITPENLCETVNGSRIDGQQPRFLHGFRLVLQALASSIPKAATANAVETPMMMKPGMCDQRSSLKTAHPHRNMTTSCANASRVL